MISILKTEIFLKLAVSILKYSPQQILTHRVVAELQKEMKFPTIRNLQLASFMKLITILEGDMKISSLKIFKWEYIDEFGIMIEAYSI